MRRVLSGKKSLAQNYTGLAMENLLLNVAILAAFFQPEVAAATHGSRRKKIT
jgi:hypothetical protein